MIYVSSTCVKKHNIAEIIQELSKRNIRNIELSGGTDYYNELEIDLEQLKCFYNLTYACHAYFPPPKVPFVVNLASCNDQIYQQSIDHYVHCIDMLKRMKCKVLSIHAGFLIEIGSDEVGKELNCKIVYNEGEAYDRFCCAYEYLARLCTKNNIDFYIENNVLSTENYRKFDYHNYMMMTDYTSIMKMKEQINFNLLLDLAHLYVSSTALGLDYAQECNKIKKYVKWIHISDNNGIFDEHKPLRINSIIMKEFNKMCNPTLNVTLETVGSIEKILEGVELINNQLAMSGEKQ